MAEFRLAGHARPPFQVSPIMSGMAVILDANGNNAVWPSNPGAVFWGTVGEATEICEQANMKVDDAR